MDETEDDDESPSSSSWRGGSGGREVSLAFAKDLERSLMMDSVSRKGSCFVVVQKALKIDGAITCTKTPKTGRCGRQGCALWYFWGRRQRPQNTFICPLVLASNMPSSGNKDVAEATDKGVRIAKRVNLIRNGRFQGRPRFWSGLALMIDSRQQWLVHHRGRTSPYCNQCSRYRTDRPILIFTINRVLHARLNIPLDIFQRVSFVRVMT